MRARFCHHCHTPVPFGVDCQCAGARATRDRVNARAHDNQRTAGRNTAHWSHVRLATMRRDDYTCRYCGRHKTQLRPNEHLTVHLDPACHADHAHAKVEDCTTACNTCHGKLPTGR